MFNKLKLFQQKFLGDSLRRCLLTTPKDIETFAGLLNISENSARTYIREHNLKTVADIHDVGEIVRLCEKEGITKTEILGESRILRLRIFQIENCLFSLKEGGFENIKPYHLVQSGYHSVTIDVVKRLKISGLIREEVNVAEQMVAHLSPRPDEFDIGEFDDDWVWHSIRKTILCRYLMWRLEATREEIDKLFEVYQLSKLKSITYLCQNITLSLKLLQSEPRKLLDYGYMLLAFPRYTDSILNDTHPSIKPFIRDAIRRVPKLFTIAPKNYYQNYEILKEFGISDKQMEQNPRAFLISPKTLRIRIEELKRDPEMQLILKHPSLITVLLRHNTFRSRLDFLKNCGIDVKCPTVSLLCGSSTDTFPNQIQSGKDRYSTSELLWYLCELLQTTSDEISSTLLKHPYANNVSMKGIKETYYFLRHLRFRRASIIKAITVVLYPKKKVSAAIERIQASNITLQRINQLQKLNLIVYFIEKEHHFTGNGVWITNDKDR